MGADRTLGMKVKRLESFYESDAGVIISLAHAAILRNSFQVVSVRRVLTEPNWKTGNIS